MYALLNFFIILKVVSVLVGAILPSVREYQFVHVVSNYHNTHLTVRDELMDDQHRRVRLAKLGESSRNVWRLEPHPVGPSQFEIIHHQSNEPLCAAPKEFAYDEKRRNVATWVPGPVNKKCYWTIEKRPGNAGFNIVNMERGEELYAAMHPFEENAWLWVPRDDENEQHHWDIINLNYCQGQTVAINMTATVV
ncbi:uncharacterized protein LOC110677076 [Aedes aegypti]|uniref:Uncharacterized protein n=1 Tax=Aedes aegypti TaxID=7159 RepID=A0A6I8U0Y4_AEDAE|nr:uncharacterized protein LOC110677076 [Aedes aegypti]